MPVRPRLTPAIADVRRAVRAALVDVTLAPRVGNSGISVARPTPRQPMASSATQIPEFPAVPPTSGLPTAPQIPEFPTEPLVLVALSGGADSLALAAAAAFEGPRAGVRVGAVVVDHGLQQGSADVAAAASAQATTLGLAPVVVLAVIVGTDGGPEAAARDARFAALEQARIDAGASHLLLGHTLDDQAESVLLGLARGSGPASLHGMNRVTGSIVRPLLGVRRSVTRQFCVDSALVPWDDPQNVDRRFARVRARTEVMPVLEAQLGPGIAAALARTADQLREDAEALDHFADELIEELAEPAEAGITLPVAALASNPAALRQRLIRLVVEGEFHVSPSRGQTLAVAELVTDWHGQGAIDLPGVRVERRGGSIVFTAR